MAINIAGYREMKLIFSNCNCLNRLFKRRIKLNIRYYCSHPKETLIELSNSKTLKITTGKYARFADGSAVVSLGDTSVMATAVSKPRPASYASFVPLTVDYRQKAAALGRIPTNFLRRELGPTEAEILTSRVIDRSIRPLFPQGYNGDTQIICSPLALDGSNSPDVLAINAASAALTLSDIPWNGPIGAVRVASCSGELIVNPTKRELSQSNLNLIVAATAKNLVLMLEGFANNILLPDFQHAIKFGVKECQLIINQLLELANSVGKQKREFSSLEISDEIVESVRSFVEMRLREIFSDASHDKMSRDNAVTSVRTDVLDKMSETDSQLVNEAFNRISKTVFRTLIFERDLRCDGRRLNDLRNISCAVNLYPPLHGSALFQRGQTQVLCTVALDSPNSALKVDPISVITSGIKEKPFFVHYEFPAYATNDLSRQGGSNRREIGHGALAERGLRAVVPSDNSFTLRLTAEVLESNGSSSMATVCGGSMALMDAGVALQAPVAGVAVGLVTKERGWVEGKEEDYRILVDILGIEDYAGDMDFKLAGTKKGITAVQADIKLPGIPLKIVMEALQAGTEAKSTIINIMNNTIRSPRKDHRDNLPVMEKLQIPPHKRSKFIGLGGVNLRKLEAETGIQVMQEEDGEFLIFAPNKVAMDEAKEVIQTLLTTETEPTLEFGGIYNAKVIELRDIGCMVTLYPGMNPVLIHNSQLDQRKISHPSALGLEVGQELKVKYFGRDPVSGMMRLSRKVLQGTTSSITHNLEK